MNSEQKQLSEQIATLEKKIESLAIYLKSALTLSIQILKVLNQMQDCLRKNVK